ncbi:MAG: hypothetical protein KAU21_13795 [Gammaproteobacteria bacterium]|nr:hypothetical protein [Gammaproteobacteria bacterium]
MAFDLSIDEKCNLLTVTYDADTSYQDRINVLDNLVDILQKQPKLNIFIDTRRANENMTYMEQMKYGNMIANKKQYFSKNRTAILTLRRKNPHPIILTEAYLDGFENYCEFDVKSEALVWLNENIK